MQAAQKAVALKLQAHTWFAAMQAAQKRLRPGTRVRHGLAAMQAAQKATSQRPGF